MTSPQSSIRCLEDCVNSRASHLDRLLVQQLPREEIWSAVLKVQATVMGTGICALKIYHLLPRSGQSSHPFISSGTRGYRYKEGFWNSKPLCWSIPRQHAWWKSSRPKLEIPGLSVLWGSDVSHQVHSCGTFQVSELKPLQLKFLPSTSKKISKT